MSLVPTLRSNLYTPSPLSWFTNARLLYATSWLSRTRLRKDRAHSWTFQKGITNVPTVFNAASQGNVLHTNTHTQEKHLRYVVSLHVTPLLWCILYDDHVVSPTWAVLLDRCASE